VVIGDRDPKTIPVSDAMDDILRYCVLSRTRGLDKMMQSDKDRIQLQIVSYLFNVFALCETSLYAIRKQYIQHIDNSVIDKPTKGSLDEQILAYSREIVSKIIEVKKQRRADPEVNLALQETVNNVFRIAELPFKQNDDRENLNVVRDNDGRFDNLDVNVVNGATVADNAARGNRYRLVLRCIHDLYIRIFRHIISTCNNDAYKDVAKGLTGCSLGKALNAK